MVTDLDVIGTRGCFGTVTDRIVAISTSGWWDKLIPTIITASAYYNKWILDISVEGDIMAITRGAATIVEAEIKEYTPFGSKSYADPSNGVSISIKEPDGSTLVDGAAMTKSVTGKYYYIWQTLTSYVKGTYRASIDADGASSDGYNILDITLA